MADLPYVSVVIPMRNEAGFIDRCLDSVFEQDYPEERFEVIVVDGDSDDDSPAVLAGYVDRYGERMRVFQNPKRIVPPAMNIGIRAARGDIVMRVDAHTTLDPAYMRTGVEVLQRTGADNVGGPMHAIGGGRLANAIAAAMGSRFGIGAYFHFGTEEREVDTVYLGMYPLSVLARIGLYDEELVRNQDDELNYRLRKAGGRIVLTPEMRSWYQNRTSVKKLARQFYQYGLWKVRVLQKHPRQMSPRQFVPPTFVATVIGTAVLAPFWTVAAWLCAAAIGAYLAACAGAASLVARKSGWVLWPAVFLAFVTMHVSWGWGFLRGLVRFGVNWFRDEAPVPQLAEARDSLSSRGGFRGEGTGDDDAAARVAPVRSPLGDRKDV